MQNDTLETDVKDAVEQGHDIQETVRQLTLRRISARSLDIESVRQIAKSVLRGAKLGVQKELNRSAAQTETARIQLRQAVSGLDSALGSLAEASRLAIEEATSRAQKFSDEDLSRTRADLQSLETILMETLHESVADAKDAATEILHGIAEHSRTHGSIVGAAGHAQAVAGLHLAQATSDLVRQIAAGMLTGIADHVKPSKAGKD